MFEFNNIHHLNRFFKMTVCSYTFCCVMSNKSRRKIMRSRLRMTTNVKDFTMYPHIDCPFCKKKIIYKPVEDYEFDTIQMTPCCGSPVHKQCTTFYVEGRDCVLCDIPLERVGPNETKPCFDLELTLHHTINRYNYKDMNSVPRNLNLPNIFKR